MDYNAYQEPNSPNTFTSITGTTYYTGLSYETKFNNPLIINGNYSTDYHTATTAQAAAT